MDTNYPRSSCFVNWKPYHRICNLNDGATNMSGIDSWGGLVSVSAFGGNYWASSCRSAHQNGNLMSRSEFNTFYSISDQNRADFAAGLETSIL
ncbi:MAG: hypothetical protein AAF600_09040 [Bacteroidota bacterium]